MNKWIPGVFRRFWQRPAAPAGNDDARDDEPVRSIDHRRHPRESVAMAVVVTPSGAKPVTAVIDLSEGGTCLDWSARDDISKGTPVHLCFLLDGDQTIELDGRVVRTGNGYAGIEFLPAQQDIVRQLLAEARSDD